MEQPRAITILAAGTKGDSSYVFDEAALRNIVYKPEFAGKPVAIVSVAGAFRKGKSFMLNFFVHYLEWLCGERKGNWFSEDSILDKFHFRGGSERDTQGIQMWSQPFLLKQNGKELIVLLMDTQGTFDSNTTVKQCATIFALSTMISSLQIYNVSQNIQEDDLQHLQLFTAYGKMATEQGNSKPFQSLMFLIRDWQSKFEYNYGFKGGRDFLDKKLKVSSTQNEELKSLRTEIRGVFDKIECFLMPHPGLRIANNQADKRIGAVEVDFNEQIKNFVPSVFGEYLKVKKIAGRSLSCYEIVQYFKATADAALMIVVANSKALYDQAITKAVHGPPPLACVDVYVKHHNRYQEWAVQLFDSTPKLGDAKLAAPHLSALQKHIDGRYHEFLKIVSAQQKLMENTNALEQLEMKRQADLKKEKLAMEKLQLERDEKAKRDKAELDERKKYDDEQFKQKLLVLQRQKESIEEEARQMKLDLKLEKERLKEERRQERAERMNYGGGGGGLVNHIYLNNPSSGSQSSPGEGSFDRNGRYHDKAGRFAKDPNK